MAQPPCIKTTKFPKVPKNTAPVRPLNIFFHIYSINGPVANATIKLLEYYDPVTENFKTLTQNTCNKALPIVAVTDNNGNADLCLLSGTYIIQFTADNYNTVEQQYTFVNSETVNVELTYNVFSVTFFASGSSELETSYEVTFIANGLQSGTTWSVTFNGNTLSSTSSSIMFRAYNGTYSYTIGLVSGYSSSPSSGSITINNASVTQAITFTKTLYTYLTITLTNNQSIATPAPFQQLITINPTALGSANFSADLGNIRFYADSAFTQPLYAWVESGNSNTSTATNIWVKLPNGIPANSSITIYMLLESVGTEYDGIYMGEAPQLSPSYAQFDNGANVFNNYWNFVGTTLPSDWTGNGYTVNNGLTVNGPGAVDSSNWVATSNAIYNTGNILEFFIPSYNFGTPGGGTYGIWEAEGYSSAQTSFGSAIYLFNNWGAQGTHFITSLNGTSTSSSIFSSGPSNFILTMYSTSSTAYFGIGTNAPLYNNSQSATLTSNVYSSNTAYISLVSFDSYTDLYVTYIRIRSTPPNGTMPSVSISS